MFTKTFWKKTLERVIKSFAGGVATLATATQVFNVFDADWGQIFGVSAGLAVVSLALSIASAPVGPDDTPSVV